MEYKVAVPVSSITTLHSRQSADILPQFLSPSFKTTTSHLVLHC